MSQNGRQSQTTAAGDAPARTESSGDATTEAQSARTVVVSDAAAYRCPICQATYRHEVLTRVHITRVDDDAHAHHNGLMPETDIEVVDSSGNVRKTISRPPEEIDTSALTVEDFPDELSEKRRHALLVAAQNPYEETARGLTDILENRAEETELAMPAYKTVCRAINSFYQPDESGTDGADTPDESLSELTPKQQAIVIARLAAPSESEAGIADMVGCASSYPGQVYERAGHVINRLESRCVNAGDLEPVIADELTSADIEALHERDLLTDVAVEVSITDDSQRETAGVAGDDRHDQPSGQDDHWGSPVENQATIRAVPEDPIEAGAATDDTTATASGQTTSTGDGPAGGGPKSDDGEDADETDGQPDRDGSTVDGVIPDHVPVQDIERLRQNVRFLKQTLDRTAESGNGAELVVSFAEQIDQQCTTMLEGRPEP